MLNSVSGLSRTFASGIAMAALSLSAPLQTASAQDAESAATPATPTKQPKLIIAISMDQFSGDLWNEYRQHFTGGLKRMADGAVFSSAFQGHSGTETCPGHSTLLTGSFPGRTGIIANDWIDWTAPRDNKEVYCVEDAAKAAPEGSDYYVDPSKLLMPTLGELMVAHNSASRNVSVSGKDRAALMMGGKTVQQTYYWDGKGAFTTLPGRTPLPLLAGFNKKLAATLAMPRKASKLPAFCASRDRAIPITADYSVGQWRFDRPAGDAKKFRASPDFDATTLDLATLLVNDMKLGKGAAPDMLSISLSATDYVGHSFGTEGVEMCIQLMSVDQRLGQFFAMLDKQKIDYAVVLSADHGGLDTPERAREQGMPDAKRVEPTLSSKSIAAAVASATGMKLEKGDIETASGEIYLHPKYTGTDRTRILDAAIAYVKADEQVAAVFTHAELAATPMPTGGPREWSLIQRARASFNDGRSGDFVMLLKPRITPIANVGPGKAVATHGSAWDYDRRVAMAYWWKGISAFEQPQPVATADILPTMAALIGLPVDTSKIDGRCLDLDNGPGTTCPR